MYSLARAESNHLAQLHFDPTPDHCESILDRQRNKQRTGGYRDKGYPRQALPAGCEAQIVQRDLRQARTELALTRDEQAEDPVRAARLENRPAR
jgi:hypothetical protein